MTNTALAEVLRSPTRTALRVLAIGGAISVTLLLWIEDGVVGDRRREPKAWARDPVCDMRVDAASASFVVQQGAEKRIVFCSQRCLDRFNATPTAYLAGDGPV